MWFRYKFFMEFQLTNLTLKHLVEENQFLINGFVNKIQTTPQNLLKMKIHTKKGDKNVLFTNNAFFITEKSISAKQNPGGFSALLKKYLFNQRIISIQQKGVDRIVVFEFPEKLLIFEFFSNGNVILCEKDYTIIKAMRKEKWKDRELKKGEKYKFPSSRGKNPLEETKEEFFEKLKINEKSLFGAVLDIENIAPQILETIFENNRINKKENAKNVDKKTANTILDEIQKIYLSKATKAYISGKIIYSFETNLKKEEEFESLNKLLEEKNLGEIKEEQEVVKIKKKTENYEDQIKTAMQEEIDMKKKGEQIYIKYSKIEDILNAIKKGRENGKKAKEIKNRINSVNPVIKELDLDNNRVILDV